MLPVLLWFGNAYDYDTGVQLSQMATDWRHHKMLKSKNGKKLAGISPLEANRINPIKTKFACMHRP